jgi:hypothetical protein
VPDGWDSVARMARIGVRSRSLKRSVAGWIPLNHADLAHPSELARTAAPNRQAGGHWFEPSAAHRKSPAKGFFVASRIDVLKIDKSFVLNMESDEDDETIVRSTIALSHLEQPHASRVRPRSGLLPEPARPSGRASTRLARAGQAHRWLVTRLARRGSGLRDRTAEVSARRPRDGDIAGCLCGRDRLV